MPNEKEVFGMPKVLITFRTKSVTAISRSARGIVAMILKNEDVSEMSVQQIREYNTGTNVYLTGRITPVNAMEDLKIDFTM